MKEKMKTLPLSDLHFPSISVAHVNTNPSTTTWVSSSSGVSTDPGPYTGTWPVDYTIGDVVPVYNQNEDFARRLTDLESTVRLLAEQNDKLMEIFHDYYKIKKGLVDYVRNTTE